MSPLACRRRTSSGASKSQRNSGAKAGDALSPAMGLIIERLRAEWRQIVRDDEAMWCIVTRKFTCIRVKTDANGCLTVLAEDEVQRHLKASSGVGEARRLVHVSPPRVLLDDEPSLVEWDNWPGSAE